MVFFALLALVFIPLGLFNLGGTTSASGTIAPSPSAVPMRATLQLRSLSPLTVAGTGFKARETVEVSGVGSKKVQASTKGSFVVRFSIGADRCKSLNVAAVGSKGSRATLNFSELLCLEQ